MRVLATIALSFSCAVFLAVLLPWSGWLWYASAVCALGGVVFLILKKPMRRQAKVRLRGMLIFFSAAAALVWVNVYQMTFVNDVAEYFGQNAPFEATVAEYPIATDNGAKVTLSLGFGKKAVYYGDKSLLELQPGNTVTGEAYWQDAGHQGE